MSQSSTMTIRLASEVKDRLDQLSEATQRSKSFLASEAILDYIEINEWQINEIKTAIKEADAGDFASESEVSNTLKSWGVNED